MDQTTEVRKKRRIEDKVFDRFSKIKEVLSENQDQTGLNLLKDLVASAGHYVTQVNRQVVYEQMRQRPDLSGHNNNDTYFKPEDDTVVESSEFDISRARAHEAFISLRNATMRWLDKKHGKVLQERLGDDLTIWPFDETIMNERHVIGDQQTHNKEHTQ